MKKLFLGFVMLFSIAAIHAQKFNWGIKGGLNISLLSGDIENTKSLTGFNAGVFGEFRVLRILAIQPEIVYSSQGTKFEDVVGQFIESLKLDYINVPVIAKFYLFNIVYLEAGPQLGFLTSAKLGSVDYKVNLNSNDFAIAIGTGVNIVDKFRANARLNAGLTDIDKSDTSDVKGLTLQIGAAYIF